MNEWQDGNDLWLSNLNPHPNNMRNFRTNNKIATLKDKEEWII